MKRLLIALLLGVLTMANPNAPTYYLRLVKLDGTYVGGTPESGGKVLIEPLPVESITFTETAFVPDQSGDGSWSAKLREESRYRQLYELIDYEQRAEIFNNRELLGDPVFTGVVRQLPVDLSRKEIAGPGILWRLEERRLRQNERLTGNAATVLRRLLKTYQPIFMDDFNRTTGLGTDWLVAPAGWAIVNGVVETGVQSTLYTIGPPPYVDVNGDYLSQYWQDAKISFKATIPTSGTIVFVIEKITGDAVTPYYELNFTTMPGSVSGAGMVNFQLVPMPAGVILEQREISAEPDTLGHFDIFSRIEGANRRVIVDFNNVQIFDVLDTRGTLDHVGYFAAIGLNPVYSPPLQFDDFIFGNAVSQFQLGYIGNTAVTIDQTFNGDSQKVALDWIAKYLGWEYRINPQAGAGNDTIDIGPSIGRDLSNVLTLEEGKNIKSINRDNSADELATWAKLYPQASDNSANGFVSVNIAAIRTYGVIETEYSDPRVVDSATAKTIGDVYLDQLTNGKVSISGRVVDESWLLQQDPRIGYLIIGDAIIGGQNRLRAGDWVWLDSPKTNTDKKIKLVSITRKSCDPGVDVVFDCFRQDRLTHEKRTLATLLQQIRAYANRINSTPTRLVFSGAGSATWMPTLVGNIASVTLDVCSGAWGGQTITALTIDGTDLIPILGAPINVNKHIDITPYIYLAGEHTIIVTVDGALTLDAGLSVKLLG